MKRLMLTMTVLACACMTYAQQEALMVSELLYQPRSGEAEYVELYNNGDEALNLADYHIVRWVGDSLGKHYPLPEYTLGPRGYVALTKDVASVTANYDVKYPSNLLECDLPPYPNSGGSVVVCTADSTVVARFDYSPSMHSRLLRNKAGVALERRSFDRPTSEAANWFSASSMSGYGTPGYENSQSAELLAEEASFDFSSAIVSPDGDEYDDVLEINYQLEIGDLAARAEVYDARGRMVRRLLDNVLLGAAGTIIWDCRDDRGALVAAGHYAIVVTLYDLGGTRQQIRRAIAVVYNR